MGVRGDKVTVIVDGPDLALFDPSAHPRREFMADGTLRIVYTGALTPIYELDVVVRAVASMARSRPSLPVMATFYGRGDTLPSLQALAADLDIADRITFGGRIPIEDVPRAVAEGDIAVAPTRLDPFTGMSMSTKVLEGAAMDKPVVASRLPAVERYFKPDTLSMYESGDPESLSAAILALVGDATGRAARVERTRQRLEELSWSRQGEAFLEVVDRLTAASGIQKSTQTGPKCPARSRIEPADRQSNPLLLRFRKRNAVAYGSVTPACVAGPRSQPGRPDDLPFPTGRKAHATPSPTRRHPPLDLRHA